MDRRKFIQNSCTYCIGAIALGLTIAELTSCVSALPVYKTQYTANITVPITSFLQSNVLIVRSQNSEFDILLVKKSATEYMALLMKCTHRDNPLSATKDGLYCPAHGSHFDLNGAVTQQPATEPLKHYKTILNQSSVTIITNS